MSPLILLLLGVDDWVRAEPEVDEPDISIQAAAEVVDAIAVAEIGSWWLCVPSYVVIKMDMSSAHLCTYKTHTLYL